MTVRRYESSVIRNTELAPGTIALEIDRAGLNFRAGEEIILHGPDPEDDRTYSIASGESDASLLLLIRIIPDGRVTPRLARLRPGDPISFSGPTGSFILRAPDIPLLFIATGTGLAPFRSMMRSHPGIRPILLHGVRHDAELYFRQELEPRCAHYRPCLSRDPARPCRVTDALADLDPDPRADVYLCGGQPMIRDARAALLRRGISPDRILAEIYYFW